MPNSEVISAIEASLGSVLDSAGLAEPLAAACRHAVLGSGKRVRPQLALLLAQDLCGDWQPFVRAAAALELVHCSSLVHDDLPALDNDDMRRDAPSCHKAYGEATAILAGDA